jgi:cell division septation protein DedD
MAMAVFVVRHIGLAVCAAMALSACEPGQNPFKRGDAATDAASGGTNPITGDAISATTLDSAPAEGTDAVTADASAADAGAAATVAAAAPAPSSRSTRLVDRDVEAPEIFQTTDTALWDGRPSLGGVWIASPDATDPERVILRNPANGNFVIGALFRRERDNPGPKLQISSDAAEALGVLAGQPAQISVTALRREETPAAAPSVAAPVLDTAETIDPVAEDGADIAAGAAAALEETTPAPAAETAAPAAGGDVRIQVGIFSLEANATRAADTLTEAGIAATIRKEASQGKDFWSVIASGTGDKAALLEKVNGAGFADAYLLSR